MMDECEELVILQEGEGRDDTSTVFSSSLLKQHTVEDNLESKVGISIYK